MSISKKQGLVGRPGIVLIVPTRGYMKPAPMLALTSLIGSTNPEGAPFCAGIWEKEYWVFAIQMGKPENPCLVYISICFSALERIATKNVTRETIICTKEESMYINLKLKLYNT